ncbi:MAG: hypothetical protein QOK14_348 [Frankiaceae bacterium]|nr:hypothetical protein [Frankiaceae bacterium]
MTSAVPAPPRLRWLDGLRGVAALFVVLHHVWLSSFAGFPRNTGPAWLGFLLYGHLPVAVFIVLSGFSLALAPMHAGARLPDGFRGFIRRRAWRILPPYFAALVFSMPFLILFTPGLGLVAEVKAFVVHALLLQDVVGSATPNGTFWSIAVEWQIYFTFPLILWIGRRWSFELAAAATAALVVASYLVADFVPLGDKVQHLSPQFLALFAFGVLTARATLMTAEPRAIRIAEIAVTIAAVAFIAGVTIIGSVAVATHWFWTDLVFGTVVAAALGVLALRSSVVTNALSSRPLRYLGAFSYSLYLTHAPIVAMFARWVVHPLHLAPLASFWLLLVLVVPAALVVARLFFLVFERPFLKHRGWDAFAEVPGVRRLLTPARPDEALAAPIR